MSQVVEKQITNGPSVYVLADSRGQAIYVGSTNNAERRLAEHRTTKPWWGQVASVEIYPSIDRRTAFDVERQLIQTYNPPFNTQSTDVLKRFGNALQAALWDMIARPQA